MNDEGTKHALDKERNELLQQIEEWVETPMLVLGFIWLALLVVELLRGLSPLFEVIASVIWIIFIIDFVLRFVLAPYKITYLKSNWLVATSLVLPAFRVLRIVRILSVLRLGGGLRLLRVVTSLNRGMGALRGSMGRRGFGYVAAFTLIVAIVGAAGMYTFENNLSGGAGLNNYGSAMWWTIMLMTTIGSDYWPRTPEGRMLCILLSLYSIAVFGYITALLATFFVGRDAENDEAEIAGAKSIEALRNEIAQLRAEINILTSQIPKQ